MSTVNRGAMSGTLSAYHPTSNYSYVMSQQGPAGSREVAVNRVTSLPRGGNGVYQSSVYRKDEFVPVPGSLNNVVVYRNELYQKVPYSVSESIYRSSDSTTSPKKSMKKTKQRAAITAGKSTTLNRSYV